MSSTLVIRSIDSSAAGSYFVLAIEADKIIFVEGADDAHLLHKLFSMDVAHQVRECHNMQNIYGIFAGMGFG